MADKKKDFFGLLTELDTKGMDALLKKYEVQHEQPEDALVSWQRAYCGLFPLWRTLYMSGKELETDGASTSPQNQYKPFSMPHIKSLECCFKEELIAQGCLESEDFPAEDSEKEVLGELRKWEAELKALGVHSRIKMQDLLTMAKEEVRQQELRQTMRSWMPSPRSWLPGRRSALTPSQKRKGTRLGRP